jgi:serine/threonine protein kinase
MFAVGVLVYEMLTGRPPAPEAEPLEQVRSVPPWLRELARRCLEPEPGGRWADAATALGSVGRPSGGVE